MRLVILTTEFGHVRWGGLATYVDEVTTEMLGLGVEVQIAVCPTYAADVSTDAVPDRGGPPVLVSRPQETAVAFAERLLADLGPKFHLYVQDPALVDIVLHLREQGATLTITTALHLPSYGGFSYFDEPEDAERQRLDEASLYQVTDNFVAPSRFAADIVSRIHRVSPSDITVIPLGVRPPLQRATRLRTAASARESPPLRVVSAGRLAKQKGLFEFIDVVRETDPRVAHFTHAGRAIDDDYEKLAHQAGATFLGSLEHADAMALFADADIVLSTSLHETFGLSILEGMSRGCVPLAFDVGAVGELITHGRDGFLTQTVDVAAMTSRLTDLHHDRDTLRTVSSRAVSRSREFTWNAHAAALQGLICS